MAQYDWQMIPHSERRQVEKKTREMKDEVAVLDQAQETEHEEGSEYLYGV